MSTRATRGSGVWVADTPGSEAQAPGATVAFTFWWPDAGRWEGRDFRVMVATGVAGGT